MVIPRHYGKGQIPKGQLVNQTPLPGHSTHETEIHLATGWFHSRSTYRSEEPSCTQQKCYRQQYLLDDHKLFKICIGEKCKRPSTATETVCGGTKASLTALGLLPGRQFISKSPAGDIFQLLLQQDTPRAQDCPCLLLTLPPFSQTLPSHLFLRLLISPAPPGNFLSPLWLPPPFLIAISSPFCLTPLLLFYCHLQISNARPSQISYNNK